MAALPRYEPLVTDGQNDASFQQGPMLRGLIHDRPAFAYVEVELAPNEKVLADGRSMLWMDGSVHIDTNMGDTVPACKRYCAGESCCQNTYTGPGKVSLGMKLPGDILPFAVQPGEGWVVSAGAFICGTPNCKVDSRFSGCAACICGGEGPFLTHITVERGLGVFYAGGYGALTRHEVPEGKTLFVDSGLFFAANENRKAEFGLPGGCFSCLCGGEGFVMKFRGPCVVYTQNRNKAIWNKVLRPRPRKTQQNQHAGAAAGVH